MSKLATISSTVLMATALTVSVSGQEPQFKARELFYNPITPPTTQAKEKPVTPDTTKATEKPVVTRRVKPVKKETTPPATTTHVRQSGNPGRQDNVPVVNASLSESSTIPLALRYTIQKRTVTGKFEETDIDSVFRSGDRLRVSIEANDAGYLYIVQQGSSKNWNVLFPSSEINSGNNLVKANAKITIPSESAFHFDEQPGEEKMFIILSRKPEENLEKLIYSLSTSPTPPDGSVKPTPVRDKGGDQGKVMLMASARINNDLIDRLSAMKSRDLVFEKVDENSEYGTKEKAFYAGTPDTSASARVVALVTLKHE